MANPSPESYNFAELVAKELAAKSPVTYPSRADVLTIYEQMHALGKRVEEVGSGVDPYSILPIENDLRVMSYDGHVVVSTNGRFVPERRSGVGCREVVFFHAVDGPSPIADELDVPSANNVVMVGTVAHIQVQDAYDRSSSTAGKEAAGTFFTVNESGVTGQFVTVPPDVMLPEEIDRKRIEVAGFSNGIKLGTSVEDLQLVQEAIHRLREALG